LLAASAMFCAESTTSLMAFLPRLMYLPACSPTLLAVSRRASEASSYPLRNWRRVRDDDPEGYLRRTMCNLAADNWRRRVRWGRRLHLLRDDNPGPGEATAVVDQRDQLIRLLRQLPPRQRAVIVLRYWEQRSEAEVAELLGCTEGTVKSAASRGLHKLRELVETSRTTHADLVEDKS